MIASRAPVRFSLGGGGTDLPAYANQHGGFIVAAAINKYVYLVANRRFLATIRLSYSKTETVGSLDEIEHRIFREGLRLSGVHRGIELVSIADVPANSGLGSSGAFTVALLNVLHAYKGESVSAAQLAEEACHLEIDVLREPIGKQDQYISAFGGIAAFTFNPDGTVHVEPVPMRPEVVEAFESNLLIFYSGVERPASVVLTEQRRQIRANTDGTVERMHRIKQLGYETRDLLVRGHLDTYGELLDEHWVNKRKLAPNMTDSTIDAHYAAARKAGALGGKLMGAGGGGFFMFYVRPQERRCVFETLEARGLRSLPFRFHFEGARIVTDFHLSTPGHYGAP
jgi:D-glycero-alpha-D-manno-heptose-7-phosphate kinase